MRSARRPTRSRTCSSRISSSRATCSAPRAGASRPSPPTATWVSPPRSSPIPRRFSDNDRKPVVVHSAQIAYHKPALLNDLLTVTAQVKRVGRVRLEFDQAVMRGEEVLASAQLSLACVSAKSYRPVAVPEAIRKKLEGLR